MQLALDPTILKLISDRVKSGKYRSAEDVVTAAVVNLKQVEEFGDFRPGELDALLAEGEKSIQEHGLLDGEEAFEARKKRLADRRKRVR
jgi:Arc/MetJ-type ribon-helix-helix transcriptional regulator